MNFQGKATLVFLQEDNIARAFFRIRPLLTAEGLVTPEDLSAFPDEGYLRIVPDKNEQHTFKERMRTLCGLCMMDLRYLPAEANKIRTNKNYSPSRGETNQYIIYSDAVRELPDDLLYQVISEENAAQALTPCVYIRKGANIQGPFRKDTMQPLGDTAPLPPDSQEIYAVTVNEQELLFYFPGKEEIVPAEAPKAENASPVSETAETAPEEAPAQQDALTRIQGLNAALSETANLLREEKPRVTDYIPEQPQKPLVGTRLYTAPGRSVSMRRAHNPLMEAVEQQRYATKYEAPGAVIPQTAEFKDVQNPVDVFKRALQSVCQTPEAQRQAVDAMVHQPGMKPLLSKALCANPGDATLTAMHAQLQELEAERLMTLMQLDDTKKNLSEAREELIGRMTADEQKQLTRLRGEKAEAQKELEALQTAQTALEAQRAQAAETVEKALVLQGQAALSPAIGENCTKDELTERLTRCFTAAGFRMSADDALEMLILFAQADWRLEIAADTKADAKAAAYALAAALGAPIRCAGFSESANEAFRMQVLPGGNAPALVVDQEDLLGRVPGALNISLNRLDAEEAGISEEYEKSPYAVVSVTANPEIMPAALPEYPPVSRESLTRVCLTESPLSGETVSALSALRLAIRESGAALPLTLVRKMAAFIAAGQNDLRGGVAEAIDRAAVAYAVPHIRAYALDVQNILPVTAAMPRTSRKLKDA